MDTLEFSIKNHGTSVSHIEFEFDNDNDLWIDIHDFRTNEKAGFTLDKSEVKQLIIWLQEGLNE